MRTGAFLFGGLAAFALAACDAPQRLDAARDVQAFLQAVQTGDRQAFEAHIDRPALRSQLRGQVTQAAAGAGYAGADVEAFLGGQAGDAIIDQMIAPETFRIAWKRSGVSPDRVPSTYELAPLLRITDQDTACLHDLRTPDACVLTFRNQGGTYRLTSIQPTAMQIQAARPAPPQG